MHSEGGMLSHFKNPLTVIKYKIKTIRKILMLPILGIQDEQVCYL